MFLFLKITTFVVICCLSSVSFTDIYFDVWQFSGYFWVSYIGSTYSQLSDAVTGNSKFGSTEINLGRRLGRWEAQRIVYLNCNFYTYFNIGYRKLHNSITYDNIRIVYFCICICTLEIYKWDV